MRLSIGFLTGRERPRLEWALDDIAAQAKPDDEIQLVVIDAAEHVRTHNVVDDHVRDSLARASMVSLLIVPVRPNIWQGRHRVTASDWWSTAASRNTFLCVAEHDYIAFLDDCCHLGPAWMETVRAAQRSRSVLTGSFEKTRGTVTDHRLAQFPRGRKDCTGAWLYGCTFCLPLEWALHVNGFEEGCDGSAGEDYMFGLMLDRQAKRIDFEPDLHVIQDREVGDESCVHAFRKMDKGSGLQSKNAIAITRFGSRSRTEFTPDLREIRARLAAGESWSVPDPNGDHRDWYDGQLIRELGREP